MYIIKNKEVKTVLMIYEQLPITSMGKKIDELQFTDLLHNTYQFY